MFESITGKDSFGYSFEKIRNAITNGDEGNIHAATRLGLDILEKQYVLFEQEMDAAGSLPTGHMVRPSIDTPLPRCGRILLGIQMG